MQTTAATMEENHENDIRLANFEIGLPSSQHSEGDLSENELQKIAKSAETLNTSTATILSMEFKKFQQ